ncbi:MAG: hypothetical protein ABF288_00535 [Octadecabacter sp.]
MFEYSEFTTRNIGFVTPAEQAKLRDATVFVCGAGGMGGACILGLVRAGVGTDDLGTSLLLYRRARALGYPTIGTDWDRVTEDQRSQAFLTESEWVVSHSSSRNYIDLDIVGDMVAGKQSRMSFAPMVITTGQLMCYEVINAVLGRAHGTDNRGYFFDTYKARVERPKPAIIAAILRPLVRKLLNGLMK